MKTLKHMEASLVVGGDGRVVPPAEESLREENLELQACLQEFMNRATAAATRGTGMELDRTFIVRCYRALGRKI